MHKFIGTKNGEAVYATDESIEVYGITKLRHELCDLKLFPVKVSLSDNEFNEVMAEAESHEEAIEIYLKSKNKRLERVMKAKEHFDLPVSVGWTLSTRDQLHGADGNGIWYATFCSDEQAEIAARCINHADALADALVVMIQHNWSTAHVRQEAQKIAEDALAAYRGEK